MDVVAGWFAELLGDADEGVRWNAALGLWRCGAAAGIVHDGLEHMLTDHASALRLAAVVGLLGAAPRQHRVLPGRSRRA